MDEAVVLTNSMGAGAAPKLTRSMRILTAPPRSATAQRRAKEGESWRTVVIALLANVAIGVAKLIAGIVSHSGALIAEAAHSGADCVNEVFLAVGLYRGRQPPDEAHPLGHARERFLWAFMAAITSFLVGGCLSIGIAIVRLRSAHHPVESTLWAWIVLAISFAADGTSWVQGMRQARAQAKDYGLTVRRYLGRASDPVVRAVVVEDTAALIGLILAAAGLAVSHIFGAGIADSIASLAIGVLLAVTAFFLARPFADFLVGRSIPLEYLEVLRRILEEDPAVEELLALRAMYSGPEEAIVVAKVRPSRKLDIGQIGRAMDDLDRRIRAALPVVADVFIDVTAGDRVQKTPSP
ncbi:MAG TPA: cation diffusion facilitator family transporter [Thermoanaerobaculia bacterium]|nr:cation diffusion facilitator family transporter [Thermoanaerobaculia bacterium]